MAVPRWLSTSSDTQIEPDLLSENGLGKMTVLISEKSLFLVPLTTVATSGTDNDVSAPIEQPAALPQAPILCIFGSNFEDSSVQSQACPEGYILCMTDIVVLKGSETSFHFVRQRVYDKTTFRIDPERLDSPHRRSGKRIFAH